MTTQKSISYYSKNCSGRGHRCNKYCLDVEYGSRKNHASVISYPCHRGPNQKFRYNKTTRQLKSQSSRKCLDIVNHHVVQTACQKKRKTQKWKRHHNRWISLANHRCMDVENGHYPHGHIITYPCHRGPNQAFYIK